MAPSPTTLRPPTTLRRGDRAVVQLLCALLPGGFRERQRAEWTGDLMTLASPGSRGRYLLGAARTLPALRRLVRRGRPDPVVALDTGAGARETLARILLIGLIWPLASWVLHLPLRYLSADADRLVTAAGPLWLPIGIGAFGLVVTPFLITAIGLVGGPLTLLFRRRPVHRPTVALLAAAGALAAVLTMVLITTVGLNLPVDPFAPAAGLAAVALGATTRGLTARARAWLVVLGVCVLAVAVTGHTTLGASMYQHIYD